VTVFLFINGLHYVLLLRVSMPMHAERNIVMANLSVCLSVCLSHAGIVSKRMNILSNSFLHLW